MAEEIKPLCGANTISLSVRSHCFLVVICNDGREYVGEPTIFRDHDATSLPGSDCISFYESNTYRVADFFRAEIKDIVVICKQEAQEA